jgi:hypothetical protein
MLTIRREQMHMFDERALAAFLEQAIAHLRSELPEATAGLADAELSARVRACMPRAARYGLESAAGIMAFVDATYLLDDERFDADPDYWWAPEILDCPYLSPIEKARQLLDSAFAEYQLASDD